MKKNEFGKGLRDGLPICLAYLSVGFAFGMSAALAGLSPLQATAISMVNVTSAGQFAGLTLIAAHASLLEMALTQLIINMRYALMSLSLSQKVDDSVRVPDRLLIAFVNTDEVFAVASGQKGEVGRSYLYGLILTPFFGWAGGTLMGAVSGGLLPASVTSALGIAIFGMFIALVVGPASENGAILRVVILAAVLSCCFRYIPVLNRVSSGFVIIICTLAASLFGAVFFPVKEETQYEN